MRLVKFTLFLTVVTILVCLSMLVGIALTYTGDTNLPDDQIGGAGEEITPPAIDIELSMAVIPDADGKVPEGGVSASDDKATVEIPAGVQLEEGATSLKLTVDGIEESEADVDLSEDEVKNSLDVHIEGVAKNNTVPMEIKIFAAAVKGLNSPSIRLFHVENGETVEMSRVAIGDSFTAHNQFKYDPATGDVTLYMATFSEVALVNNTVNHWKGEFDYSWYDASKTELVIANADQLAAFGGIVGGMKVVVSTENGVRTYSDEVIQDSFKGKTVKLVADISIGDTNEFYDDASENDIVLYPIGYWNNEGTYERLPVDQRVNAVESGFYAFEGTFDGNNHTISDWHHNTWEMKGDHNWYNAVTEQYYRDGMGLFGKVYGGTVKNLVVKNFSSDGEITTTGVIAAYADGATFENIAIFNCNPRVYNIGNGGIVGCVGWYAKEEGLLTTFKNITVDNTNKISALWGSYDVACGGIVGQYYPTSGQTSAGEPKNGGIYMEKCHVAAQLDVYNDVCGNYMYYAYRYAGMLIGSVRENETGADGRVYPSMTGLTFSDCTVHYGQWNHYYYCEFEKNGHPSYAAADEYKFSRVPESELVRDADGNVIGCTHDHTDVEDNRAVYLPFEDQIVTGYGWGVTSKGIADVDGVTTLDRVEGDSQVKFDKNTSAKEHYQTGTTITLGELFKAAELTDEKLGILKYQIHVAVTPANDDSTAGAIFALNTETWENSTLTFTGAGYANIIISDYYFCIATTIQVEVRDYLYKIEYINNNEVLATTHVGFDYNNKEYVIYTVNTNTGVITNHDENAADAQALAEQWVKNQDFDKVEFGGWVNAGSTEVNKITAGNEEDIKLYPFFKSPYTARFVDQQGTVLAWSLFHSTKLGNISTAEESARNKLTIPDGFSFEKWEVHITDANGNTTSKEDYNANNFKNYTSDVTVYPVFKYNGDVSLIPIDSDGDGDTDYYQVKGYGADTGKQELVEIPGYVNGIPVTTINADAFSSYDDLHSVVIPGTVTVINSQSFTADNPNQWGTQRDTVTLYYAGDPAVWNAAMEKYVSGDKTGMLKGSWDNCMGESSCVFFLDEYGNVDLSKGYWELANTAWIGSNFVWQYHNHAYGSNSGCGNEHNNKTNYTGNCDCDSCNGARRPDADYWN